MNPGQAPTAPGRAAHARPNARFDLRSAFSVERRIFPAFLLAGLVTAWGAVVVGAGAWAWGWLATFAAVGATRFLLATEYASTSGPLATDSWPGRCYLGTAIVEILLWGILFALAPRPADFLAGPAGFAAAGSLLLAALGFGGWPRVWTFYVAAWVGLTAIAALRTAGSVPTFMLVFPLWLLAIWWLGRQQPLARH